jgi:hypothetical protein
LLAFDLDSTLLDNSPRQARIMAEYGVERDVPELAACRPEHWQGWDFRIAMTNLGLGEASIRMHGASFREYWLGRFFTSQYCAEDRLVPGAAEFVRAIEGSGARICYLTGRHEPMRDGTLRSFARLGLPAPDDERVRLWMKPSMGEHDDAFKERAYRDLNSLGELVAAFDNEPTHINGYYHAFPGAIVVHLCTDCSPRPVPLAEGIASISDFLPYLGCCA